jgi:alpha-1,3-rhamnosyl/mannosyltransferase
MNHPAPRRVLLFSAIDEASTTQTAGRTWEALRALPGQQTRYDLCRAPRLRLPIPANLRLGRRRIPVETLNTYFAWLGYYPLLAAVQRADVYHITAEPYAAIARVHDPRRCVVTVHHETPAMLRDVLGVGPGPTYTLRRIIFEGVLRAAYVVTASEFIRRHLLDRYPLRPERVVAIPYGVPPFAEAEPAGERPALRRQFDLADDRFYLLHVGHCGPSKNVEAILRAMPALPPAIHFVQAGGRFTPAQETLIDELDLRTRVRSLGFLPDRADLAALYRAADLLVFPSLLEGFGLPLLEAMASGLPAVASDFGTVGEVAGDGALTVDTRQPAALAAAIASLYASEERREVWRCAGLRRAAQFSWRRCAEALQSVYQAVYEETRR